MQALLVDDAQVQRRFVALVMAEFHGLKIDEASNGAEALRKIGASKYDLILLDINLPHMTGIDLVRNLRQQEDSPNADTPIVIISSQADDETLKTCKELGVNKFLSKPVPAVRIRDAVRELLRSPEPQLPPGAERRRIPRLNIPVQVRFGDSEPLHATTSDISPFGAFVVSDDMMPVGTQASITIELPHLESPLVVGCKVVHVRDKPIGTLPRGFGVRFSTDRPEDLTQLVRAFTTP